MAESASDSDDEAEKKSINSGSENDIDSDSMSQARVRNQQQQSIPGATQQYVLERKQKIEGYYSTTYYGAPVSFVAWNLCSSLRFGNVGDLLWYGCVGMFKNCSVQQLFTSFSNSSCNVADRSY